MEAERRPDPDRLTLDGGDQRLFECREPADEPPGRGVANVARAGGGADGDGEEIADVVAGGEDPAAPLRTSAPTSGSRSASSNASISASYIAPVSAFFFSGRSKAADTTAPSRRDLDPGAHALSARTAS